MDEKIRPLLPRIKEHKDSMDKNTKSALEERVVNNSGNTTEFEVKMFDTE